VTGSSRAPSTKQRRGVLAPFAALALAFLVGGVLFHVAERRSLRTAAESELDVIARLKAEQVHHWRAERIADGAVLADNRLLARDLGAFVSSGAPEPAEAAQALLRVVCRHYEYDDALISDAGGTVRWSLSRTSGRLHESTRGALRIALSQRRSVLSELHEGPAPLPAHLDVVAPILSGGGDRPSAVGAIVLRIRAHRFLFPLVAQWPAPSRTAETLIVRSDGTDVLFLNETRHHRGAALSLRVPLEATDVPAAMAVRGRRGVVEGLDYRGVSVLAALTAVPESPWVLVAKVDTAEALALARSRSILIAVLVAVLVLATLAGAAASWQSTRRDHYRRLYQAERVQVESEARFRVLFESMTEGCAHCRMLYENGQPVDFVYLDVNPAFGDLTGLRDVIGRRVSEVIPGVRESNPEMFAIYGRVATTRQPERFETFLAPLGIWFRVSVYSPAPEHFVAEFENVTESKRAEQARKQNERIYRAIGESIDYGVWVCAPDGRNTYASRSFLDLVGITQEQCSDFGWGELLHPEDAERTIAAWKECVRTEGTWDIEHRFRGVDGQWHAVLARGVPVRDERGELTCWAGINLDVTARRTTEQALRDSEAELRAVFELASIGIAQAEPETGRWLRVNPRMCELTGYGASELRSLRGPDITHPQDRDADRVALQSVLHGKTAAYQIEKRYLRKDGGEVWVSENVTLVRDSAGRPLHTLVAVQDVSARKEAEAERETAIEFLSIVNRSRSKQELVREAVSFFRGRSGCEAVGIRLRQGEDFPYYETRGFPEEFVLAETRLCRHDDEGATLRDGSGSPVLDCMCGSVLSARFDPGRPFFSQHGSFWTNCTTELLASTTEAERQGRTRNRCNGEGYESVALIPLVSGDERLGLLQLNDRRRGLFSATSIASWERLASYLSVGLAKLETDDALVAAHKRLRLFVDSNIVGVVIANSAGQILEANDYYLRLIEVTRDELVRGTVDWRALTPPEWLPADERAIAELRERGTCTPYEKEYLVGSGRRVPVLLIDAMLPGPGEEIAAFVLDLTQRKQAEREVLRLNEELEQRVRDRTAQLEAANRELEAFSYSVSHDLRAPLRSIDGWSKALQQEYGPTLDAQAAQYLERLRVAARRMGELIEAMLRLARVTRAELQPTDVDLSALVEAAVVRLRAAHPGRQVETVADPGVIVRGDAALLEVLVTNLLDNAWKFTAPRTTGHVEFGARSVGGERVLFVRDDGAGFDMKYAGKLFGAFQRLHPAAEFSGTGVGLATVQRIVHRHGGRVWAEGTVGRGATFSFTLSK
jgi:PAS domain S-box-containing protein